MGAHDQASSHMSREARKEFFVGNLGHFRQASSYLAKPVSADSTETRQIAKSGFLKRAKQFSEGACFEYAGSVETAFS